MLQRFINNSSEAALRLRWEILELHPNCIELVLFRGMFGEGAKMDKCA